MLRSRLDKALRSTFTNTARRAAMTVTLFVVVLAPLGCNGGGAAEDAGRSAGQAADRSKAIYQTGSGAAGGIGGGCIATETC